jgi:hypothetical protein
MLGLVHTPRPVTSLAPPPDPPPDDRSGDRPEGPPLILLLLLEPEKKHSKNWILWAGAATFQPRPRRERRPHTLAR